MLAIPTELTIDLELNWYKEHPHLRSQNGQNGQIPFISGEQLFLIVAGDSAKTLSVLGNMGDSLDDCLLRVLQMCRRPPQKYPRFGGPTDFSEKRATCSSGSIAEV